MHPIYMSLLEKFEVIFPMRKGYRESASAEFDGMSLPVCACVLLGAS